MKIIRLKLNGIEEAIQGLALSYYREGEDLEQFLVDREKGGKCYKKACRQLLKLTGMGGGHDKIISTVTVSCFVTAPRYFWSQYDAYKIGSISNSASTMHTLGKNEPLYENFSDETPSITVQAFQELWHETSDINELKAALPEGWLQTRYLHLNLMTVNNMIKQRENHRLKEWKSFCLYLKDVMIQYESFLAMES